MLNGTEFIKSTEKEWRRAAEKLLKGRSFKETLYNITEEGITLKPIYFESDQTNRPLSAGKSKWHIAQTLFCENKDFNTRAKEVFKLGQTALNINLNTSSQLGRNYPRSENSVRLDEYSDFKTLFSSIDPTFTTLFFNAYNTAHKLYEWYVKCCYENKWDSVALNISLGGDPVSAALIYGGFIEPWEETLNKFVDVLKKKTGHPGLDVLTIQADIIHNSGGHRIQQLVYVLGLMTKYITQLAELGIKPSTTLSAIRVKMAVGNDQFMEIAKLRALRLLGKNIAAAYAVENYELKIDVQTSWRWLSAREIYNNMLRATGQAFSAIVGGCDSLDVLPFDLAANAPNEFSLRQARNLQIILAEEAYLNKVLDPAAGSYYLDNIIVELARKSWQIFQKLEEKGGIIKGVQSGRWQSEIKDNAFKQEAAIENGSQKVIGINYYPGNEKEIGDVLDYYYNQQRLFDDFEPLFLKRIL